MMILRKGRPDNSSGWLADCHPAPGVKLMCRGFQLVLLCALGTACAFAQAAAEYGTTTSGMAGSMSGINIMNKAAFPDTSSKSKESPTVIQRQPLGGTADGSSNYIFESLTGRDVETTNRKALEEHAGKAAAKLMLRSAPSGAFVRLDGKPVGKTPLLLVVAPGQYNVSMEGTRLEYSERKVDLLPHETREFLLTLKPQFPTQVEIHVH